MRDRHPIATLLSRGRGVVIALAALGLTMFLGLSFVGHLELREARRQAHAAAEDVARLHEETEILRRQVLRLREEPAAAEELARRDLGMLRPGEIVFIIRDVDGPAVVSAPPEAGVGRKLH